MNHHIYKIQFRELTSKACLFYMLVFIFLLGIDSIAQNAIPGDIQYKKLPTNAIAKIANKKPDEAIKMLEDFLAEYPKDAEAHYGMTVAYAVKKNLPMAMDHFKNALEAGMPAERFIAGPRNLLKNLTESKEFNEIIQAKNLGLLHGPMLGDVSSTSAKIWLRTNNEANIVISLFKEGKDTDIKFKGRTSSDTDYTTSIQLIDLKPETNYHYTVEVEGSQLFKKGSFKTLRNKGEPVQLKIGFGGGAGYTPWFERMWDTLAVQSFDAFLLLGDNVYIDYPEIPEAQSYCYYRRQSRKEFRRFTPNVPIYAIWDDHDFTVNDGEGGSEINTPSIITSRFGIHSPGH